MSDQQTEMFGDLPEICTVSNASKKTEFEQIEDSCFARYCSKHYALIEKLDEIGLPSPGQQFRLITMRSFNSIQIIEYIADREIIEDMKIAIYSINYHAAVILVKLIDSGKIKNVEIIMSNLRNCAHREKEEIIKNMFIKHPQIKLFFCSSHAKSFSCKTDSGNFYIVEGSGNMSYNSRIEQYVIDNDEKMYNFSCEWIEKIKKFLAVKKELDLCK